MRQKRPDGDSAKQDKASAPLIPWGPSKALVRARWLFARRAASGAAERQDAAPRSIQNVLRENVQWLMAVPGVKATALGKVSGEPCIKVYVEAKTAELLQQIPGTLEGHAVVIEERSGWRAPVSD